LQGFFVCDTAFKKHLGLAHVIIFPDMENTFETLLRNRGAFCSVFCD